MKENIFVTPGYIRALEDKARVLDARLKEVRAEKNSVYNDDTNAWHDNFAYENAVREERLLKSGLQEISGELNACVVCPNDCKTVPESVEIWTSARVRAGQGEKTIGVVPLGADDARNNIFNYRAPLVAKILGAKVGDLITVKIPSGEFEYEILEIKRLTD